MSELAYESEKNTLVSTQGNEDAAIINFPGDKALIQSLDYFTPIVNDPYKFGQIAAANSMSDIYAMGGEPYCVMNIVCFPSKKLSIDILKQILKGGLDKIKEADAIMCGGHSVDDDEIKYGLSVSGVVDPELYASNAGIEAGDQLILTKPLGTGILATAVKAEWENATELENRMFSWAARLNVSGAKVIREMGLKGATDITGFGLAGHVLEMARAAQKTIDLWTGQVPIIEEATDLAGMGLIPEGSYANKHFCSTLVHVDERVDSLILDIVFDAQTSGGLLLAVPRDKMDATRDLLLQEGDLAAHVGEVVETKDKAVRIY